MNESSHLDELLASRAGHNRRPIEPTTVVIFGASGDLTARKLIPALYHLALEKALPAPYRIIGFARREKTDDSFRAELREALGKFSRTQPVDDAVWSVGPDGTLSEYLDELTAALASGILDTQRRRLRVDRRSASSVR